MDQLIADNMKLVYKQLHKLNLYGDDDALSHGMEGLFKAAATFDASKGFAFSTYAMTCIYNAIMMYVRGLNKKHCLCVISYNEPVMDEDNDAELLEILPGHTSMEDEYIQNWRFKRIVDTVETLIDIEPIGTSKTILQLWWKSECTLKQRELADKAGTSQAYVSRTLSAFRYKLKKELEEILCET